MCCMWERVNGMQTNRIIETQPSVMRSSKDMKCPPLSIVLEWKPQFYVYFVRINPVTGRWEDEKPDPMAGMTDEQKEYEAEKLLNVMDKLQR